jgi:hypothetical protein
MRLKQLLFVAFVVMLSSVGTAWAQTGLGTIRFDNWVFFQRNENDTNQWKYQPRLYVPYRFESGWTFTQRIDVPMIYTNSTGPGNPYGGYTGGMGDAFIEEIFDTPEVAKNLTIRASVRFVFPTGRGSPFGSGQNQWAPALGVTYRMPDVLNGVTLAPLARYFSGFNPDNSTITTTQSLNLFPAATFRIDDRWSLALYPENPITYNYRTQTWFVPLDAMLVHRFTKNLEFGFGGAVKLGNPSNPSYRYIVDARLTYLF